MYFLIFVAAFFISLTLVALFILALVFRPKFWVKNSRRLSCFLSTWFGLYFFFIFFICGPEDLSHYPPPSSSPYKLPWASGTTLWVVQGNNSFTTHRDLHHYAWDFVMPNGTQVLAARDGVVAAVVDNFNGFGWDSNYILIEHSDGNFSNYAHIQKGSALVKVGEPVQQGQPIACSGMVGLTIMPHLHFSVIESTKLKGVPISFSDVEDHGVPFAGSFHTSGNRMKKSPSGK